MTSKRRRARRRQPKVISDVHMVALLNRIRYKGSRKYRSAERRTRYYRKIRFALGFTALAALSAGALSYWIRSRGG